MTYRMGDLEIPPDEPFLNDKLDRKDMVLFLAELIGKIGSPFVLAIDSPWGNGKTTLIRMLEAVLKNDSYICINFNAWEVDYVTDPLVAMVSALVELELTVGNPSDALIENFKYLRNVTSLLAKRGPVLAAKALTAGVLDLDNEIGRAKSTLSNSSIMDIVDMYSRENELLRKFKTALEEAVSNLSDNGELKPLVFFIDELDRCRPSFAIELLERIKHLLSVPNVIFVLSIDKSQLEASTAAVYGEKINASEYLRRFIDLDFEIPEPVATKHTSWLLSKFELHPIFGSEPGSTSQDERDFVDTFTELAKLAGLTLRARERCMTRLRVVMDQSRGNQSTEPILIAFLIILRVSRPPLFSMLHTGQISPSDSIRHFLSGSPAGVSFIGGHTGSILEALLIKYDDDSNRKQAKIAELESLVSSSPEGDSVRNRSQNMLMTINQPNFTRTRYASISSLASRIDLAAHIRE